MNLVRNLVQWHNKTFWGKRFPQNACSLYVCSGLLLQQIESLLGSEGIGGLLGVFGYLQLGGGGDVAAAGADAETQPVEAVGSRHTRTLANRQPHRERSAPRGISR